MTAQEARSWIDRVTPGNWITIGIVVCGVIATMSVTGFQSEEDRVQVRQNTKDIQEIKGDYKVIIERLNQSKENDARIEKKLDEILRDR